MSGPRIRRLTRPSTLACATTCSCPVAFDIENPCPTARIAPTSNAAHPRSSVPPAPHASGQSPASPYASESVVPLGG